MQQGLYQQPIVQQPVNAETSSLPGVNVPANNPLAGSTGLPGSTIPGRNLLAGSMQGEGITDTARPNALLVTQNPTLPQNLPRQNIDPSTTQTLFPYGDLPYEEPGLLSEAGHLSNQIGMPVNEPMIIAEHTNIKQQPGMATSNTGVVANQPGIVPENELKMRHHQTGATGRGRITFRPIEGKFNEDKDMVGKMDPYCKFKIGWRSGKSSVAKGQGTHANWIGDTISLKVKNHEYAKLKVKDRDRFALNSTIGTAEIPLADVISQGLVTQWVPISKKGQVTGEVQVEMTFTPDTSNVEPTL